MAGDKRPQNWLVGWLEAPKLSDLFQVINGFLVLYSVCVLLYESGTLLFFLKGKFNALKWPKNKQQHYYHLSNGIGKREIQAASKKSLPA